MWKMQYFEVLHVEIAQTLQVSKISLIFKDFSLDFQFLFYFSAFIEKLFWKRVKWVEINATLQENMIFWLNFAPEPR